MLEAYRAAATLKPRDTNRGIMDASNTRNIAYQRLAHHYEGKGDYREAVKWWKQWHPTSWCGTCLMGMYADRDRRILNCYTKGEMFVELIKMLEPRVFVRPREAGEREDAFGMGWYVDPGLLRSFVAAHDRLGKRDELARRAEAWGRSHRGDDEASEDAREVAVLIKGIIGLHRMVEANDDAGLFQRFVEEERWGDADFNLAEVRVGELAGEILGERKDGKKMLLAEAKSVDADSNRLDAALILARAGDPRIAAVARDHLDEMADEKTRRSIEATRWFFILLFAGDEKQVEWAQAIAKDGQHELNYWASEAVNEIRTIRR